MPSTPCIDDRPDHPSDARRRRLLGLLAGGLAAPWATPATATGMAAAADAADAWGPADEGIAHLALGWRLPAGQAAELDRVGVLAVDWAAGEIRVLADHPAPGRVHGLHGLPDGGFVAVANRPGRWLMRCDAEGRLVQHQVLAGPAEPCTLGGHALPSADGAWLYTGETDPATGEGWIGVRDAATLRRVAAFASQGLDPHQMLRDDAGHLWVANGGIPRRADGRKTDLARMAPALVHLHGRSGDRLAEHRLPDPRLSIRHLAWSADGRSIGIALQAEHDDERRRQAAPLLAVLDGLDQPGGARLRLPSEDMRGAGYAGDIAAGPGGGFVLSGQKAGLGLWWHPGAAEALTTIARLGQPCALASWDGGRGVLIAAERGLARWHVQAPARMLRWPTALLPDNHLLRLA